MGNSKYSNVLTVILIIAILAIIGLLVYVGVDWYIAYTKEAEASDAVDKFNSSIKNENDGQDYANTTTENIEGPNIAIDNTITNIPENTEVENNTNTQTGGNSSGSSSSGRKKLGKYDIIGKIEIPKTKIEYVIVDAYTPEALNMAICKQYGPGLNQIGNTVLIGHNYRNGTFFSNNSKLSNGDKIYITDETGKKVTYEIVKTYVTSTSDYTYAQRETNGKRGISLSTCTNDTNSRLIIWADEI